MAHPLGTLLASPIVQGSALGTYGTHFSHLGIGGWQEFDTTAERDAIPLGDSGALDASGFGAGRRRLGMAVYVRQTDIIYQLKIRDWDSLSAAQRFTALANNNNWEVLQVGGGSSIKREYSQAAHGFLIGEVIAHNGLQFVKDTADVSNSNETLGMVSGIIDPNAFEITYLGFIDVTTFDATIQSGITSNTVYFVSTTTAGAIQDIEPFNIGEESKPIMITQIATEGIVLSYRGVIITDAVDENAGGQRIQKRITQSGHSFIIGDVLAYSGGSSTYIKALAVTADFEEALGIVSEVIDPDQFIICYAGFVEGLGGVLDHSGNTLSADTTYFVSPLSAGTLSPTEPDIIGQVSKPMLVTLSTVTAVVKNYRGSEIQAEDAAGGESNLIGGFVGRDEFGVNYLEGIFTDIDSGTTTIGIVTDRWNRLFSGVIPAPPPQLNNLSKTSAGLYAEAKLGWGVSRNDIGYIDVGTQAGNSAVDISELYISTGATRIGVTDATNIGGILNDSVIQTLNYSANSFNRAEEGTLSLELNGTVVDSIDLTLSTGSTTTASGRLSVSELRFVTFDSGKIVHQSLNQFKFRTGTYIIPNGVWNNGFNYLIIRHIFAGITAATNYLEWVAEPNSIPLVQSGATSLSNYVPGGLNTISGIRYHTTATVDYNLIVRNVYKNEYSNGNAIQFPRRVNLGDATNINRIGSGIINTNDATKTLPNLDAGTLNPQNTDISIISTHTVTASTIIGGTGNLGRIETNCTVDHPLETQFTGNSAALTSFLFNNEFQVNDFEIEDFVGELNRLEDKNYVSETYSSINGTTHDWSSAEFLNGGDANHNTGLLILNGELLYPNAAYITTTYGITTGNFGGVTNQPGGNPDYTSASGIRTFYRKFKSNNAFIQSTLTFEIDHTGTNGNFMTDGGTGGIPAGDQIKFEVLIKRTDNITHGVFNPFATIGNPEGVENILIESTVSGTRVSCTLSTTPRVDNGDIIIVTVRASSGWTNRINRIAITNI